MTDEQINIAIATHCGWKDIRDDVWHGVNMGITDYGVRCKIPNYCTDLNAMHEAEKIIFPYYATVYSNKLARVTGAEMSDDTDYFCATARQRAEAFLRAIGKWQPTDKDSLTVGATTEESSVDQKEVQK